MIVWEVNNGRLDVDFAGALLATAGSDVYAVRDHVARDPDSLRSHLIPFLRKGKRELRIDEHEGSLVSESGTPSPDCILVGWDGVESVPQWLLLANEYRAAMVFVSDFGISGPYSGRPASELTLTHLGGVGYFIPGQVEDLANDRPLGLPRDSVSYVTGLIAAGAALAELLPRRLGAEPAAVVLDVSAHETVASFTFGNIASITYDNAKPSRSAEARPAGWAVALLRCKDGHVCLVTLEDRQWQNWLHVLGDPEWGSQPLFADRNERSMHWDALEPLIEEITSQMPTADIVARAQALRVPCTAVATVRQLLSDPHLNARAFFERLPFPGGQELSFPALRRIWPGAKSEVQSR